MRVTRSDLGLALLLATAAAIANPLEAQLKFDLCRTANPNASVALGTSAPVNSTTTSGSYFAPTCYRYVVDVKPGMTSNGWLIGVTAGASALPGGKKNSAGFAIPASSTDCSSYSQLTSFYKKAAGEREFTQVHGVSTKGEWNGTTCVVQPPAWKDQTDIVNATYRIAVGVKMANAWRGVTGRATATQIPR
jgi:hypothetical protein